MKQVKSYYEGSKYIIENEKQKNPAILGKFKAILSIADQVTQNGTMYEESLWDDCVLHNDKFKEKLNKKVVFMQLSHPETAESNLERVCAAVVDVWKEGKEIWGTAEVFNTPNGQIAWALLNAGVQLGVSSRALGDSKTIHEGNRSYNKIEKEGFDIIAWDLVCDPSCIGAGFKSFTESKKATILESFKKIKDPIMEDIVKVVEKQELDQKFNTYKLEATTLKSLLNKKEVETKNLMESKKLAETKLNTELSDLSKKVSELTESLNKNSATVISKDKTINTLNESIKQSKSVLAIKEAKINELFDSMDSLKAKLEIYENELKEKNMLLEKAESEKAVLKESKKDVKYEININPMGGQKPAPESMAMRMAKKQGKISK